MANIGIVTTWYERGAAYVSRQYAQTLSSSHQVFIYARGEWCRNNQQTGWQDYNAWWGKPSPVPVASAIDREDFLTWLHARRISIVFFNEQHWWPPVHWATEYGAVTICYVDYYTPQTVGLFGAYDVLICNTRRHYEVFHWHPQCYYVPWGTDVSLFSPRGTPEGVVFFHSAGWNPYRKGTDLVIRAFEKLKGEDARLIVHSQVALATFFPGLVMTCRRLQQAGRLTIIEETVPAPGLYHLGNIYVYPTRLEGIGLTVVEALASGMPVITTRFGPMTEFVDDEVGTTVPASVVRRRKDGYFWPECEADINQLAAAMDRYAQDRALIAQQSVAARSRAVRHFNWRDRTETVLRIFGGARRLEGQFKERALDRVRDFEKHGRPLRVRFAHAAPRLARLARGLAERFRSQ